MAPNPLETTKSGVFNRRKFVSSEAQRLFNKVLMKKRLIKERGFVNRGAENSTTTIEEMIVQRHWEVLCYTTSAVVIPVVKEFYSNLHAIHNGSVYVRGRWVTFTPSRINELYSIENTPVCHYSNFVPTRYNLNEIYRYLTDEPDDWEIREDGYVSFSASLINPVSKHWHFFISSKLLPTMRVNKVSKECLILNYCIQSGLPIDVGSIIVKSALGLIVNGSIHGLGHPSTIFALCSQYQVSYEAWEKVLLPWKPLDPTDMFPTLDNNDDITIISDQASQNNPLIRPLTDRTNLILRKLKDWRRNYRM